MYTALFSVLCRVTLHCSRACNAGPCLQDGYDEALNSMNFCPLVGLLVGLLVDLVVGNVLVAKSNAITGFVRWSIHLLVHLSQKLQIQVN